MDSESSVPGGQTLSTAGRTLKSQAIILGGFVVLIWFLELIDMVVLDGSLDKLGVPPNLI